MSSRQLEEYQERRQDELIAAYLGLTYSEYISLDPSELRSQDDYGLTYLIEFHAEIPAALSKKIADLNDNQVEIPSSIFDQEEDYDE
ncbi:hypothetical protein [Comamonas sp. F1-6]|uniref:hypothetical protein n=1 Tax=Comamonas sp. F1-6 TaxID=673550 RepID=UPI0031E1EA3D